MTDTTKLRELLAPEVPTKAMIRAAVPWLSSWTHMRPLDRLNAIENAYRAMTQHLPGAQALLDEVERQAARIEELEMEARVFDEEHAGQNRMVDRIADLIGIPHDQELTSTAFELWFSALGDKS
jgi:hypothetical protein